MNREKRAVVTVISDLVTDQRVHRTALTLKELGYHVTLVGRRLPKSLSVGERPYRTFRFRLPWHRGPLFYAAFNIRLFIYLLFKKTNLIFSNDLDTLTACFLSARLKSCTLIYDSHEFFTEVPELVSRPKVQRAWRRIEKMFVTRVKNFMTVNDSIARLYAERYGIETPVVVRNVPLQDVSSWVHDRSEFGIPADKKVFLFQGAGINIDRGAEEAIDAISHVDAVLLFIGSGDVFEALEEKVNSAGLENKVYFIPKQPMKDLQAFTRMADFGLTLDKDTNPNYRYSLPNKLFDYIHAGLPVLATPLVEVAKIVQGYEVGLITPSSAPGDIAATMRQMAGDETAIARWKENLKLAAAELRWENEKQALISLVENAK